MSKKLIGIIVSAIVGFIILASVVSADSVLVFKMSTPTGNLDGYTTNGITFNQTSGPDVGAMIAPYYGGLLLWKGELNRPSSYNATNADGSPVVSESGRIVTPGARVYGKNRLTFTFGRGDKLVLTQAGPEYCGQSFPKLHPYDNSYALTYGPQVSTLEMNATLLVTCIKDRSALPLSQFTIYGADRAEVQVLTVYSDAAPELAPSFVPAYEPTPDPILEPIPMITEPIEIFELIPESTPAPEPALESEPESLATDPLFLRMDKLEQALDEEIGMFNSAIDGIKEDYKGNWFVQNKQLYDLAAKDAELEAKDAAQDIEVAEVVKEVGFLKSWLNKLQGVIDSLPFIGKGNKEK